MTKQPLTSEEIYNIMWDNNEITVEVPIAKYVDKLVKAWEKYGKLLICVDFDDTLVGHQDWNKELCHEVCKTIAHAQKLGAKITLWTCRQHEHIMEDLFYLFEIYGLDFNDINPTEPFKERFSHKPYCNIMLDDKCGLEQSLIILQQAIQIYESRTATKSDEGSGDDRSSNER